MKARLTISTAAAVGVTLAITAGAFGARAAGGASIASAPIIPLGQQIDGDLGNYQNNFGDRQGEYFKVNLQAGDRVQIRVESAGDSAPCPTVYLPGTDDFNFSVDGNQAPNQNWNVNTNHFLSTFIAGRTGTYIIAMNNLFDPCYDSAADAAYSFEVLAPHYLRLSLPTSRTVRNGQTLTVGVYGALSAPVTDSSLRITLSGAWGGGSPKPIGHAFAQSGHVVFTLHIPSSLRGKRVRLIASGGDGIHWIGVSAGRSYLVR